MKPAMIASALSLLVAVASANKFLQLGKLIPPVEDGDDFPVRVVAASANVSSLTGNSTFAQILDHNDLSKGTFSQRFWWNAEYWAGPGSPVVLFTPGEIAADNYGGYLTNQTITGLYAQEIKGAVIMVERESLIHLTSCRH